MNVKIGTLQMPVNIGNKKENLESAIRYIKELSNQGANIVVLPEMFLTGYNLAELGDDLVGLAETVDGPSIQRLADLAKDLNVVIAAPIPEIREIPGIVYNSVIVISSDGEVLGSYAKTHLWTSEKKYFRAGNSFPIFDTSYGKLGVMLCYDAAFPEVARIMGIKGVEIILMPSAWRIKDLDLWDLNTRSRALENSTFLAATNIVGKRDGKPHFFGNCRIINPRGNILAQGETFNNPKEEAKEDYVVEEINLNEINEVKKELQYLKDRRSEIYEI